MFLILLRSIGASGDVRRDGCRHDSHRAQVHDPDDEEDRRQAGTALAAVKVKAQAVPASAGNVRPRPGASRQQAR
ncbi:MAG TPA: hypothetical protein VHJ19_00115 [Gammaproteobacteria bacterium]|nr:hypothetical protein [Gammaproteobacteria bacterium]